MALVQRQPAPPLSAAELKAAQGAARLARNSLRRLVAEIAARGGDDGSGALQRVRAQAHRDVAKLRSFGLEAKANPGAPLRSGDGGGLLPRLRLRAAGTERARWALLEGESAVVVLGSAVELWRRDPFSWHLAQRAPLESGASAAGGGAALAQGGRLWLASGRKLLLFDGELRLLGEKRLPAEAGFAPAAHASGAAVALVDGRVCLFDEEMRERGSFAAPEARRMWIVGEHLVLWRGEVLEVRDGNGTPLAALKLPAGTRSVALPAQGACPTPERLAARAAFVLALLGEGNSCRMGIATLEQGGVMRLRELYSLPVPEGTEDVVAVSEGLLGCRGGNGGCVVDWQHMQSEKLPSGWQPLAVSPETIIVQKQGEEGELVFLESP